MSDIGIISSDSQPCEQLVRLLQRQATKKSGSMAMLGLGIQNCAAALGTNNTIILCQGNSFHWIVVALTCLLYGKTLIALDKDIGLDELKGHAQRLKADLVIGRTDLEGIPCDCVESFEALPAISASVSPMKEGHLVLFTTGTRGMPKGVQIPLGKILRNTTDISEAFSVTCEDRFLLVPPFSHAMGFIVMMMAICYAGDMLIAKDYVDMLRLLKEGNASAMALPPAILTELKDRREYLPYLADYRLVISGSAGLEEGAYEEFRQQGICVVNGYGMTECVSAIAVTRYDDASSAPWVTPLRSCELRLSGDGEIHVRGASVCEKYLGGEPIAGSHGWYPTGDLGEERDGKWRIYARKDSVYVLRTGYKINIDSMEARILELPAVSDCRVTVKGGTGSRQERVLVLIVPAQGATENVDTLKAQINERLAFFERVHEVALAKELDKAGGKKEI